MVSPHADSFGILFSFFFVGVLFCSWKLLKFLLEAKYKRDSFTKGEKKGGGGNLLLRLFVQWKVVPVITLDSKRCGLSRQTAILLLKEILLLKYFNYDFSVPRAAQIHHRCRQGWGFIYGSETRLKSAFCALRVTFCLTLSENAWWTSAS